MRSATAYSVLEGWTPNARAVELLAQFDTGTITFAEYRAIMSREAAVSRPSTLAIIDGTDAGAKRFSS
ncbi:hypothetical protein [Mycobacterium paraintracellulare]|uniref:antitoxin VbhA family protein n=1 Tax=Mycobacterium paraintracellulare TaxID=1138383 RepID=UPI003B21918E